MRRIATAGGLAAMLVAGPWIAGLRAEDPPGAEGEDDAVPAPEAGTVPEADVEAALWFAEALESDLEEALARAREATVAIEIRIGNPVLRTPLNPDEQVDRPPPTPASAGSGVLIDAEGHVLTNYHVVGQATAIYVGLPDGRYLPATKRGIDRVGDVAVIKLEGEGPFPFVEMGDSDTLEIGQWGIAMGNPWRSALNDFRPSVSIGVISGLHRYNAQGGLIYGDAIQIDAPINPGNSGGPLFDIEGRLIGINGKIDVRRGRINSGIGFAITINQIKRFLDALIEGEDGAEVFHGLLGVEEGVEDVAGGRRGAFIDSVMPGSPAQRAGLEPGYRITEIDGMEVRDALHLVNYLSLLPEEAEVQIFAEKEGHRYEFRVTLARKVLRER